MAPQAHVKLKAQKVQTLSPLQEKRVPSSKHKALENHAFLYFHIQQTLPLANDTTNKL